MGLRRHRQPRKTGKFFLLVLLFILIAGAGASFFFFFEGSAPVADLSKVPIHIGKNGKFDIRITDTGSGLRQVTVSASQKGVVKELYYKTYPRLRYTGQIGPLEFSQTLEVDAQKLGFTDGEIEISVMAYDFSLRGMFNGNAANATKSVILDTKPPRIQPIHSEKYISPGGTGIVIYNLSDNDAEHGVVVNGMFNRGHIVGDGRKDVYIAYFALPFDTESVEELKLTATDIAGNVRTVPLATTFKKVRQKRDRINISDGFLSAKIPEFEQYYPDLPGDNVEKYLHTNQVIRKENNTKIFELCQNPISERLWEGKFSRMAGSGRAGFADHRTYYYKDQPIDKQVHLGMDIASTRRANVKAANTGKVVFADYLGIYGNMVLLDHGQGVFSLYSHLSQINVAVDDVVANGDSIGLTGTSGMAGGDHLHFSMLINGVFTTPKEWWDSHWIEVTITEPLVDSKF